MTYSKSIAHQLQDLLLILKKIHLENRLVQLNSLRILIKMHTILSNLMKINLEICHWKTA